MNNPSLKRFEKELEKLRTLFRLRTLRAVAPCAGTRIRTAAGRELTDFSANDYLSLSNHPDLIEGAVRWTERFGAGCRASRLITGTLGAVLELEERLAAWKGTEACLILGSGYMANMGILKALASRKTIFFADKFNHASLNLGCMNVQTEFKRYRHNDLEHLRLLLESAPEEAEKIIVADTVFSMDGDIADVPALRKLAETFNAILYLDDAHAGGVLGEKGKGLGGSPAANEIVMGTFSKAFGAYGAYVCCSKTLHDYFVNTCGSLIYSTALPPGVYGSIEASLTIIESAEGEKRRQNLQKHARLLRQGLSELSFNIGIEPSQPTPIVPLILGSDDAALQAASGLLESGMFTVAIRPPTVPEGTARLRLTLCAEHSQADIQTLLTLCRTIS